MRRASFFVVTVLVLGCCLGFVLFMSPRVLAGAVPAGHELGDGVVFAEFHEVDTRLPLPTGAIICAAEPEAEGMESLHLQVGYVRDKRVGIVTDLHNIYTSPIQVRGSDLCLLMMGTGAMLLVDQEVYDRINAGPGSPEARRISAVVTELGNSLSALAICGLISVKDPDTAYLGANAVAYSGIACLTLKAAFGRARPWQGEGPYAFAGPSINDDYNSMPSGHSATAFALATVLAEQYPEYKYVFYACASLIAVSRVHVHAHWPSDVLAGAAIGVWSANQVMRNSRILEIRW